MANFFIDDCGTMWSGNSAELRRAFDSPFSGGDFADYAVRTLGFIAADRFGAALQIRLCPKRVSEPALVHLKTWLGGQKCDRAIVSDAAADGGWTFGVFADKTQLFTHFDKLMRRARKASGGDILTRMVDAENLDAHHPLRRLVGEWDQMRRLRNFAELKVVAASALGRRNLIVEASKANSALVFADVGDGFHSYGSSWAREALGVPVTTQPDRAYGMFVNQVYETALFDGEARIDDIDAIVRKPDGQRNRLRIKRVVLPCIDATGRQFLMGGSVLDNTVDLRAAVDGVQLQDTPLDMLARERQDSIWLQPDGYRFGTGR